MISVDFTEDEPVEIANHTVFTAFHAREDDEAWRVVAPAVSIVEKLESACAPLIESERFDCAREMLVLQGHVARRANT